MSIFESEFMRRARYLPEEKRAFLLDTTDHVRQEYFKMKPVFDSGSYQDRKIINDNFVLLFEKQSATIWMLLDHPKYQTVQLIESRLEEMEKMIAHHRVDGYYTAACLDLVVNRYGPDSIKPNGEQIPQAKKTEYENCITEYINLNDFERKRFIDEIKHPLDVHQAYRPFSITHHPIQKGRQRES